MPKHPDPYIKLSEIRSTITMQMEALAAELADCFDQMESLLEESYEAGRKEGIAENEESLRG